MGDVIVASLVIVSLLVSLVDAHALSVDYYAKTCPDVDAIVAKVVKKAAMGDSTVPSALLRMHFHDCFIRGCDGSVLLNSTKTNKAEKDGTPNISLHAFYVIDHAKEELEAACPGVVSCADIIALAARDSVALSGGPSWEVPKGRKDGRISIANETKLLPPPTFNFSQLIQSFSQRGLSLQDLVALSGGHTLGFAHCSSFQNRIHKFNSSFDVDPAMEPQFAASLRQTCPIHNKARNAGSIMDPTATVFDNMYYKHLVQGRGLFTSDQALLSNLESKNLVHKFAESQEAFEKAFVKSILKMGSLVGEGEVRLDCRVVR
ncbi:peroxidase 64 [Nymphaea colorata]|nr:peroxidase 64 [Nymphaea colorata]